MVWQLKEHSWTWPQEVCKHTGSHFSSSCPLCGASRPLGLSDLLSSQESHIMLLAEAHTPTSVLTCSPLSPLSLSLSLEIHSQYYAAVATLTWGEASQGPLLIVWPERQPAGGEVTADSDLKPFTLYFLQGRLSFPLHACSRTRVPMLLTLAGSLSCQARLIYLRQPTVTLIHFAPIYAAKKKTKQK